MSDDRKKRLKIAIVVPNPCNPDYRVIRQAETLAAQGHEVRIFATAKPDVPSFETFNGVTYVRSKWAVMPGFISWLTRLYKRPPELAPIREEHQKILEKARAYKRPDA